jgi:hypothetical protein
MACILVLLWLFVFYLMIRALVLKRLLWPEEEDAMMAVEPTPAIRVKEKIHRRQSSYLSSS